MKKHEQLPWLEPDTNEHARTTHARMTIDHGSLTRYVDMPAQDQDLHRAANDRQGFIDHTSAWFQIAQSLASLASFSINHARCARGTPRVHNHHTTSLPSK
eukprot:14172987-Alexandrium_andersonii.AAC.1